MTRTPLEEELYREAERPYVSAPFLDLFDREFAAEFGRYPTGSPLAGTKPPNTKRRDAIQALIDRGATEGERAAAQAALHRLDHPSEQTHAATERGSYYARDTLTGSSDERSEK